MEPYNCVSNLSYTLLDFLEYKTDLIDNWQFHFLIIFFSYSITLY